MKKAFESGKIWTILSAFIFVMTCGLVVLAANGVPSGSVNLDWFDQFRSTALKNTDGMEGVLTAEHWNDIMSGLDSMIIPKGAIMAFDKKCPKGWSPYQDADGRFLRGTVNPSAVGDKDGSETYRLDALQLPNHDHYIRYGRSKINFTDPEFKRSVVVDWRDGTWPKYPNENNRTSSEPQSTDSYQMLRTTRTAPFGTDGDERKWGTYTTSRESHTQEGYKVMNPYVYVMYCIKD